MKPSNRQIPLDEVEIYGCDRCEEELRQARAAGESHIWENADGHVARDNSKLEDRAVTYAKYGV
jgi:hypothetical protein